MKEINKQTGSLFEPEFLDILSRLKGAEPELLEIVGRQTKRRTEEMASEELLKPSEVAAALKVKKHQVYRYIKQGLIPASRLPGSRLLRIRREDLESYILRGFEEQAKSGE